MILPIRVRNLLVLGGALFTDIQAKVSTGLRDSTGIFFFFDFLEVLVLVGAGDIEEWLDGGDALMELFDVFGSVGSGKFWIGFDDVSDVNTKT